MIRKIVLAVSVVISSASAQPAYFVALGDGQDPATQAASFELLDGLITKAQSESRLLVFDGAQGRRLAETEVSKSPDPRVRRHFAQQDLRPAIEFVRREGAIRDGEGSRLDIPATSRVMAMSRGQGEETTVIVIGTPWGIASFAGSAWDFQPPCVPNSSAIMASDLDSPVGTKGFDGSLSGVAVHWLIRGTRGTPRELRRVEGVWRRYFEELGATVVTFTADEGTLLERVLAGEREGRDAPPLEAIGERPGLICEEAEEPVKEETRRRPAPPVIKSKPPAPASVKDEPDQNQPDQPKIEPGIDLSIAFDGTSSHSEELPALHRMVQRSIAASAKTAERLKVSITIFRNKRSTDIFNLTRFDPGQDDGRDKLEDFFAEPRRTLNLVEGSEEESGGTRTGETVEANALDPVIAHSNLPYGVANAISQIDGSNGSHKLLVIASDTATAESDGNPRSISRRDRAAAQRVENMVQELVAEHDRVAVITLFTGAADPGIRHREHTTDFFKRLAAIAGPRGTYTEDIDDLEQLVVDAIKNMQGVAR